MIRRLAVAGLLAFVSPLVLQRAKRGAAPAPAPAATTESASDEIYRLGREALARGAFETASRLFGSLAGELRWANDARFAFNRAQACRYAGDAGEAVFWYGRYLALDPKATDAKVVLEQIAKLVKSQPKLVRLAAMKRLKGAFQAQLEDYELERALLAAPQARLLVRFERTDGAPNDLATTTFLFPGRAIYWRSPEAESADAVFKVHVVSTAPIAPPEGTSGPPLLVLPPGQAFVVSLGAEMTSRPVTMPLDSPLGLPRDPDLAVWRLNVSVEIDRAGPPVLLNVVKSGPVLVDVKSGPTDGALVVGKKRREPAAFVLPLSFGPRVARPDARAYAGTLLAVLDLAGKEGAVERWAAPISAVEVTNRFGKLVPGDPARIFVRTDGTGPFLTVLKPPS